MVKVVGKIQAKYAHTQASSIRTPARVVLIKGIGPRLIAPPPLRFRVSTALTSLWPRPCTSRSTSWGIIR